MRWLVAVLALALGRAEAQETLSLGFQSVKDECGWFEGSFDSSGYRGKMREVLPKISCRLVDGVGALCVIVDHGLSDKALVTKGNFRMSSRLLVVETDDGRLFNFRLMCARETSETACLFHLWNVKTGVGYSCNLEPLKKQQPKSDVPKAPPSNPKKGEVSV